MARIFDVIEVPDMGPDEMVRRFPETGSGDFRIGSQVIVRESQVAVFFRDGKALDTFGPGRHTISTANIPLLVNLIGTAFGNRTPFTAEVYFVNVREFPTMGWGTRNPIPVLHPGIGMGASLLRAYGTYGMQITDPQRFVTQFVGAQGTFSTDDIQQRLRAIIVSKFRDVVGEIGKSAFEIQGMTEELSAATRAKIQTEFEALGIAVKSFFVEEITPSEKTLDELVAMGLLDPATTMKLKSLQTAVDVAAASDGGGAGMGVGLGVGAGVGASIGQMMGQVIQQSGPTAQTQPTTGGITCPSCGTANPPGAKFCSQCGTKLETAKAFCTECGKEVPPGAKFCPHCGAKLA